MHKQTTIIHYKFARRDARPRRRARPGRRELGQLAAGAQRGPVAGCLGRRDSLGVKDVWFVRLAGRGQSAVVWYGG